MKNWKENKLIKNLNPKTNKPWKIIKIYSWIFVALLGLIVFILVNVWFHSITPIAVIVDIITIISVIVLITDGMIKLSQKIKQYQTSKQKDKEALRFDELNNNQTSSITANVGSVNGGVIKQEPAQVIQQASSDNSLLNTPRVNNPSLPTEIE